MYINKVSYNKTSVCIKLLQQYKFDNILIVGCGDGTEAFCLSDYYKNANVIGIDPSLKEECIEKKCHFKKDWRYKNAFS